MDHLNDWANGAIKQTLSEWDPQFAGDWRGVTPSKDPLYLDVQPWMDFLEQAVFLYNCAARPKKTAKPDVFADLRGKPLEDLRDAIVDKTA